MDGVPVIIYQLGDSLSIINSLPICIVDKENPIMNPVGLIG
jgi:hypothetical protein